MNECVLLEWGGYTFFFTLPCLLNLSREVKVQRLDRMQQYVKVVLQIFFDGRKLRLERLLVLAHERLERCLLLLTAVGVDEYAARLLTKAEHVRVSIDNCRSYKTNICRL